MTSSILDDMTKAVLLLKKHDVVPSTIEVNRSTFERLNAECRFPDGLYPDEFDRPCSFMGVRIVIK